MESLTLGPPHTLVQNTVYALPARAHVLFVSTTCEVAANSDMTNSITVTPGSTLNAATFIRCTTSTTSVVVKAL